MPHLDTSRFTLPDIDDWFSGDTRVIQFQVESAGTPVDLSGAEFEWRLYNVAYESGTADALLTDADTGVEIVSDQRVDIEGGEWEVRVDGDVTDDMWGEYWQRPVVRNEGTEAQWRGRVVIEA